MKHVPTSSSIVAALGWTDSPSELSGELQVLNPATAHLGLRLLRHVVDIVIVAVALFFMASSAFAQCDSLRQVQMHIDTFYAMASDGTVDTTLMVLSNELVPYYSFDFQEDSARFHLHIGEFALNRNWCALNWCDGKYYNYDDVNGSARCDYTNAQLSDISRTRTFRVVGGDTLSFFREFYWYDSTTQFYNPAKLVSTDEIYGSVELVAAGSNTRIALLDTFSLRSSGSATPCLYLWRPVVARVEYLVPSYVDSTDAFMRINLHSAGPSGSRFMRYDNMSMALSKTHLAESDWNTYAASVANANNCNQSCTFSVATHTSPREVEISVVPAQTAVDQIKVVDINGNIINATSLPVGLAYTVPIPQAGIYIVAGYKSGSVVCTTLVYAP